MGEQESKSKIGMEELLIDAANAIVPPAPEEYELTVRKVAGITGMGHKQAKYWLDKFSDAGRLVKRMVIQDGTRCAAYSTPGVDKVEGWKKLIEELKEEDNAI